MLLLVAKEFQACLVPYRLIVHARLAACDFDALRAEYDWQSTLRSAAAIIVVDQPITESQALSVAFNEGY